MNIDINAKHILPDILVFDGEMPDEVTISSRLCLAHYQGASGHI